MPRCTKEDLTIKPPTLEGYRDSEEVFYCKTTKEIFRDYDEFFRHNMLINSTIWACEITGRENLTYTEALKSEKKASEKAKGFREILKGPTLLLTKIAQQSSHNELGRLLYQFFKEQYLVGEEVILSDTAQRHCRYEIIDIVKPKPKDANSNNKKTSENSSETTSDVTTPTKNVFKYKLKKITKYAEKQNMIVNVKQIRRSQVDYSFGRLVCFLKENTTIVDGIICPKDNIYKKYVTDHNITFQSIFACELPQWKAKKRKSEKKERIKKDKNVSGSNEKNKKIKIPDNENKNKKQQTLSQYLIKTNGETAKNNNDNAENKKNLLIEMERKRKEREAKQLELEKKKAEMNAKAEQETIRVLTKCDDLERDDQKQLPQYKPIKSIVSLKYFGDLLQIQEFLHSFSPILSSYDVFQNNITFNQMCRALTVREVAGPLSDILQVLLSTIFSCQFEENEDSSIDYREFQNATTEPHITINRATKTHNFINKHYSHKIYELPIDSLTLSELIRLHLLSSGASTTEKCTKWRYMYRMGYSNTEDPGLLLRIKQPHILRSLKLYTIYQLPMDDIIKIIKCLIDQILTYQRTITILEERSEKLQKLKQQIRNLYIAENKRLLSNTNKKKNLTNEYNLKSLETQDQDEKKKLMNELNLKVAKCLVDEDKDKKEFDYKLTEARSQIFDHIINLGMDRCYRQYFIFESICGLFIEHPKETFDNNCLDNPPQNCIQLANLPHNKQKLKSFFMTRLREMEKENSSKQNNNNNNNNNKTNETKMIKIIASIGESNKENSRLNGIINKNTVAGVVESSSSSTSQAPAPSSASLPATSTAPVPLSNDNDNTVKLIEYGPQPYNPSQYELYMCTGDQNNCIVHNSKDSNRYQWSYINTEDELEALIDSLNPLGKRESLLREQLITYKSLILRHILDCPKIGLSFDNKLSENQFLQQIKSEKKYLNSNFGFNINADINEVMYNTLLDKILQFENDISKGHLGKLKVEDIERWRIDLQNNSYDSQCKNLIYGNKNDNNQDNDDDNDDGYHEEEGEGEFDDPGYGLGNTTEIKSEDSSSDDDLLPLHDSPQTRKLVKNLASALLQIEQAIEQKFLKEPFGIKNEVKDKEINETRLALGRIRLRNWESSLMRSTSYSQIFLHLNVISDAVKWTKSSNQAKCMKCRKKSLPEQMLLCDECNGGMHMFCMEPKLTSIPEGNWYCQKCTVKLGLENKIKIEKKKKVFKMDDVEDDEQNSEDDDDDEDEKIEEEDEEIEEEENEEEEEETIEEEDEIEEEYDENDEESSASESEIVLSTKTFKRSSARFKKNKVISDEDETEEEFENVVNGKTKSNQVDVSEDDSERICKECDFDGGDVMCNNCETWYHLECTDLRRPPRGRWECTQCKNKITKDKNLKRKMDEETYGDSTSSEYDEPLVKRGRQQQQKHVIETRNLRKRPSDETNKKTNGIISRRSRHLADNSLPLNSVILYDLLDSIMKNDDAWPFLRPVLPSQVPDYYDVIKKPMDFGQIKSNLNMGKYRQNKDVMEDIELVFRNCDLYNTCENYVYRVGKSLEHFVYNKCKELKLPFKPSDMIKNEIN